METLWVCCESRSSSQQHLLMHFNQLCLYAANQTPHFDVKCGKLPNNHNSSTSIKALVEAGSSGCHRGTPTAERPAGMLNTISRGGECRTRCGPWCGSCPLTISRLFPILSLPWLPWQQGAGIKHCPSGVEAVDTEERADRVGVLLRNKVRTG